MNGMIPVVDNTRTTNYKGNDGINVWYATRIYSIHVIYKSPSPIPHFLHEFTELFEYSANTHQYHKNKIWLKMAT